MASAVSLPAFPKFPDSRSASNVDQRELDERLDILCMGMLFCECNELRIEVGIGENTRALAESVEHDCFKRKMKLFDNEHHCQRCAAIHSCHTMDVDTGSGFAHKSKERLFKVRIDVLQSGLVVVIDGKIDVSMFEGRRNPRRRCPGFPDIDHVGNPVVPNESGIQKDTRTHHQIGAYDQYRIQERTSRATTGSIQENLHCYKRVKIHPTI